MLLASLASAQQAQRITPNFKDADITQIAEAVSAATGKNFIIDPRVRAQVTMLSSTPMSPAAFYEAFLSILQVYGFIAVPSGNNVVKILPDANARQIPSVDLPDHVSSTSDEIVTQVLDVKNVSAATAGADPAADDPAVRPPGGLPRFQHPHHHRPRQQRAPHDAHHPAHRPGRRTRTSRSCRCRTPARPRWCAW